MFIDGECVDVLTDKSTRSFPVAPGVHKVRVASYVHRSETLDLSLSTGDRIALECGVYKAQMSGFKVMTLVPGAVLLVTMLLGLFLTTFAAQGLFMVMILVEPFKPGKYFYLRPRTTPTVPATEILPVMQRPRITIRQGMVVVAIAALLLTAAAQDLRMQRQAQYRIRAAGYQGHAAGHASLEIIWKKIDQRRAAYHAQLKEKYLYAADHPWEPVEDDPPYSK